MIKNFYKYTMLVACATMTFASCSSDDEVVAPGEWDSSADYAVVSFLEKDKAFELDPADTTVVTLHMTRRNPELTKKLEAELERVNKQLEDTTIAKTAADSARIDSLYNEFVTTNSNNELPAIEVPITITGGADTIFTISSAKFEAGAWDGEYTISFRKAEVGTTYTVQYAITDTRFVSSYSAEISSSLTLTRVKWNPAGYINYEGQKVPGLAEYTDDFIGAYYGVGTPTYYVEVEQRDDIPGIFRIKNAYGEGYPYNDPGDWDDTKDYYMVIDASNPDKVFMNPYDFDLGLDWGYGMIFVRNYAGYFHNAGRESDAMQEYGKYENGAITFPAESFAIGMVNYKGTYDRYANTNGAFKLIIDPDEYAANTKYEATLEDDFDWEVAYAGTFTSKRSDAAETAVLYKGVCQTTTDACDSVFEAKYGTPYLLSSPYAEGYDLLFFVKNGRLSLHADFKEDYTYQEIGRSDGLNPIYARINNSDCSFSDDEVILNITFVTLGYDTKTYSIYEAIDYGTVDEKLTRSVEPTPVPGGEVKKFSAHKAPGRVAVRKDYRRVILPGHKL